MRLEYRSYFNLASTLVRLFLLAMALLMAEKILYEGFNITLFLLLILWLWFGIGAIWMLLGRYQIIIDCGKLVIKKKVLIFPIGRRTIAIAKITRLDYITDHESYFPWEKKRNVILLRKNKKELIFYVPDEIKFRKVRDNICKTSKGLSPKLCT